MAGKDLAGVAMCVFQDASAVPLIVSRPGSSSFQVDYWLSRDYRDDTAANAAVANSLVLKDWQERGYWQWAYVNPEAHPSRAAAFAGLGMTMIAASGQWHTNIDGNGQYGPEIWALKPTADSKVYADAMAQLHLEAATRHAPPVLHG